MNFIYDKITNLIIDKLESGVVPWQKNWKTSLPKNFVSGLDYKGINIMLLGMQDFESNYWLSFKQCRDIGGTVKKDEKSTMVVFWKPIVNFKDNESDELPEAKINFLLRYYYLFNIQQCNIPDEVLKKRNTMPKNPKILEAEQIIMGYPNPPEIAINNMIPNPRYLPRLDKIEIQSIDNFHSSDDYYASLFHECIHATGHSSKCNRRGISGKIVFGSEEYSREELIAECGASFLCNISGIEKTLENSASYIANWLQALKQDNRMVLIAASQAQKACDYILNNSTTNQKEAE